MASKPNAQQGDQHPKKPQVIGEDYTPPAAPTSRYAPPPPVGEPFVMFQAPRKAREEVAEVVPTPKKRNGSAKSKHLRQTDPEAWAAQQEEKREKRQAKQAERAAEKAAKKAEEAKRATDEEAALAKAEAELSAAREAHKIHRQFIPSAERAPLRREEIAQREQERVALQQAEEEAERTLRDARATSMRGAIERREQRIGVLENDFASHKAAKMQEIAAQKQKLDQLIASHIAQHAASEVAPSEAERAEHNHRAEHLRGTLIGHVIRLGLLKEDPDAGHSAQQAAIRTQERQLIMARRALAEHNAYSVQAERLLHEVTEKPKAHITMLESAHSHYVTNQQRTIAQQQQKLAEERRQLAEFICDAVKQERLVSNLRKEMASLQSDLAGRLSLPNMKPQRTKAEGQLAKLQRELDALLTPPEANAPQTTSQPKTIALKPKETRLDRFGREAEEAATKATRAREAADAEEASNGPLVKHLNNIATQLKGVAATAAAKFRKEQARDTTPPPLKAAEKPKPSAKKARQETELAPEPAPLPAKKPKPIAVDAAPPEKPAAPAEKKPQRLRYKKIPAPLRPIPPELLHAGEPPPPPAAELSPVAATEAPPAPPAKPLPQVEAASVRVAAKRPARKPTAPVADETPPPAEAETGFAAREIARYQANAKQAFEAQEAAKAAQQAADNDQKAQAAIDEAARLEAIRLDVVGRLRAKREAAGAAEAPAPEVQSWAEQEKARLAQRAKDDAAKAQAVARLKAGGILPSSKGRSH